MVLVPADADNTKTASLVNEVSVSPVMVKAPAAGVVEDSDRNYPVTPTASFPTILTVTLLLDTLAPSKMVKLLTTGAMMSPEAPEVFRSMESLAEALLFPAASLSQTYTVLVASPELKLKFTFREKEVAEVTLIKLDKSGRELVSERKYPVTPTASVPDMAAVTVGEVVSAAPLFKEMATLAGAVVSAIAKVIVLLKALDTFLPASLNQT